MVAFKSCCYFTTWFGFYLKSQPLWFGAVGVNKKGSDMGSPPFSELWGVQREETKPGF